MGQLNPVLLDVGANTGSFSLLPCVVPGLSVVAFEPQRRCWEILNSNIRLNGIEKSVRALRLALSDRSGSTQIKTPRDALASGLATLGEKPLRFSDWVVEDVPVSTLDAEVDGLALERVDLIKIDTEGHELFVLRGAKETLRRFRPLVVAEVWPVNTAQNGYDSDMILSYMSSLGYLHRQIDDEDVLFYPSECPA
ncbi:MAG: FkbM family methyltransferase [Synergistaceae bacterium]|jgi:FkbM family methyltransferase|nr:FkbM family methyltransferase [Synergistaceae bacterium]